MVSGLSFSSNHPFLGKARKIYLSLSLAIQKFPTLYDIEIDQQKSTECSKLLVEISDALVEVNSAKNQNPAEVMRTIDQKFVTVVAFLATITKQLETKDAIDAKSAVYNINKELEELNKEIKQAHAKVDKKHLSSKL